MMGVCDGGGDTELAGYDTGSSLPCSGPLPPPGLRVPAIHVCNPVGVPTLPGRH